MKKTNEWGFSGCIIVICPYCGAWEEEYGEFEAGDEIGCRHCRRVFELGVPKEWS